MKALEVLTGPFNELAHDIKTICHEKGFYDPVNSESVSNAEHFLNAIESMCVSFEQDRRGQPKYTGEAVTEHELGYRHLKLMLLISEMTEILTAKTKEEHDEEVADVLIRLLDYAAMTKVDVDAEVAAKVEKNRGRPYKHGKNY